MLFSIKWLDVSFYVKLYYHLIATSLFDIFLSVFSHFEFFIPRLYLGPVKVDILNGRNESIHKLPGERMKKLLIELKVIYHCKWICVLLLEYLIMKDVVFSVSVTKHEYYLVQFD